MSQVQSMGTERERLDAAEDSGSTGCNARSSKPVDKESEGRGSRRITSQEITGSAITTYIQSEIRATRVAV